MTIIRAGADVEARNEDGATPLHLAANGGHTETAMTIIRAGADVEARNEDGATPLHLAANGGHTETAMTIIRAGADAEARNEDGFTPAWLAGSGKVMRRTALAIQGKSLPRAGGYWVYEDKVSSRTARSQGGVPLLQGAEFGRHQYP